ncbi:MAG: NADH-quinone oxidoreductase subunit C [Synergistetes bacterium]|nr:NADH-quinone oxidoreductase subunit C [Synergistota bacterium]
MDVLSADELLEKIQQKFGERLKEAEVKERAMTDAPPPIRRVWVRVDREDFRELLKFLMEFDFPHLAVASAADMGDEIELIYHISLFQGKRFKEVYVNIKVRVPKSDPKIPTITDLIPGALSTELEKQEMMGVDVVGIPKEKLFLPWDFPEGVYPWRRDETGPKDDVVKYVR